MRQLSVEAQEQQRALSEMTPELVAYYKDYILPLENKGAQQQLLTVYERGRHIHHVLGNEAKYGAKAHKHLEVLTGQTKSCLYRARDLATTFTLEEIEQLAERRCLNRRAISPHHLYPLTQIGDVERRRELLERIFSECLSSRTVEALVQEERDAGLAGSQSARSRSIIATLRVVAKQTSSFVAAQESQLDDAFQQLEDGGKSERAESRLTERLLECREALMTQQDSLAVRLRKLDAILSHQQELGGASTTRKIAGAAAPKRAVKKKKTKRAAAAKKDAALATPSIKVLKPVVETEAKPAAAAVTIAAEEKPKPALSMISGALDRIHKQRQGEKV